MPPAQSHSKLIYRIAVGSLFFLLGLCFASWASRIPSIREKLQLTDAGLGLVLFALPLGSFLSLPLSGWLINKIGSRKVVIVTLLAYGVVLTSIGWAQTTFGLLIALFFFGMAGNAVNIAVNTQALGVQALYGRSIMASFHGLWSLAGFTGAAVGSYMTAHNIIPFYHFIGIMAFVWLLVSISARYTLQEDYGTKASGPMLAMPEKSIINLGIIAFCSMLCEGAMFDWSGIYFEKVVAAPKEYVGAGYTAFMCTMATGRFFADWFTNKFGAQFTLQCSGALTAVGLLIAVVFPATLPAVLGFLLVGFGVSSIIPLIYSIAGKSKTLSAGVALAAVSTIGFLGFLLGPPVIGLIAGATSLRISFILIAFIGLCITALATFKKL